MTKIPPITTVVALDTQHFAEFRQSALTWRKNLPLVWLNRMLCFVDEEVESAGWWRRQIRVAVDHPDLVVVPWPVFEGVDQRHRMISAFTWGVAEFCTTRWHLKLDTDTTVQRRPREWPQEDWFFGPHDYQWIAPAWGYTKPPELHDGLVQWAKTCSTFDGYPEVKIRRRGDKVKWSRMISYAMLGLTPFAQRLAELMPGPPGVSPSHDGLWSYVAVRLGLPHLRTHFEVGLFGHGTKKLTARCEEALR